MTATGNFGFLKVHDPQLVTLGTLAERYFTADPITSMMKLRQFAEVMAKLIAARHALYLGERETFEDTLRKLAYERIVPRETADLFHGLRKAGNDAVHKISGGHTEALSALKYARSLAIWFHQTYGRVPNFNPGPFVPPAPPVDATASLRKEIKDLEAKFQSSLDAVAVARKQADDHARALETVEARLKREAEERSIWEQIAQENEAKSAELAAKLESLQLVAEAAPKQEIAALVEAGEKAAEKIDLDEAATRALIDIQLRDNGWEADTSKLRYANGVRPAKGRNMAIAEWPAKTGRADYALFIGTTLVGVVEAKRKKKNVSAAIDQAQRYAEDVEPSADFSFAGGPWDKFKVPFVFATNGRAYLRQIETESGIWFRDTRRSVNHRRALVDWATPKGLAGLIEIDEDAATKALAAMPFDFGFPLRPYQRGAIEAVEAALANGQHSMLVAMATGTGKTKLAIALLYRLLAAKRFRSICFVVDRSALGHQTAGEFSSTKVVSGKTFAEIFGLKGLGDVTPDDETKVHICTIQGLVKRVLFAADGSEAPPVDQYDLIVVDECHRGYLLDRELTDSELSFRSQDDYLSKYRRVLDYFDAVKIGLTATPALHTTDIFGQPIFLYSYREAVVDGFLIDHEPPINIATALSQNGIGFSRGEVVEHFTPQTGVIDVVTLPDDVQFEVEQFNRSVITTPFNAAVANELTNHIDPALPGKTLVFAVTDAHADIVVAELKRAFADVYGEIDDSAIMKITGSVDRVQSHIRSFRNDANPKIVVTVDLLTTGIDVPSITNLVFLRRVNSRILYEQMIGRATRQCPEIGKEVFRIFDAVDVYANLQPLTSMKPVVVNPSISFAQLVAELIDAKEPHQRETIREQLAVKLRRKLRTLADEMAEKFEAVAGETPAATLNRLLHSTGEDVAAWVATRKGIGALLDWSSSDGTPYALPISYHPDQVVEVTHGYSTGARPEDFLDSFTAFVRDNLNTIAALKLVVQRPRDLTRADLKELRLALDRGGFSEASLRRAWADAKNEDIAASIIGYVRQAAIGDPLVSYEDRVKAAMKRIVSGRSWTQPQKRWLERIGEQVAKQVVVDRAALDAEPFSNDGGFTRLNKVFSGELETILAGINEEMWKQAS